MIKEFASKIAQDVYDGVNSRQARQLPVELHAKARRLLDQINAAPTIETLAKPPSNKLIINMEGKHKGKSRIKINKQFSIIFRWVDGHAFEVDIKDLH